ncbi:hypothetical protein IJ765_00400 [Candidatus Saccharibacteria bacterium]|nr:hypothetical protein [Candidatus Saccharibacteria bacterium]
MDEAHNSGIMKYLINEKDAEKFFHSSGYAREAYHGNIGSQKHPADTFDARQELENNRQFIRGYKDAKVITDARRNVAKTRVLGKSVEGLKNRSSFGATGKSEAPSTPSGPATPPARRVSGISR